MELIRGEQGREQGRGGKEGVRPGNWKGKKGEDKVGREMGTVEGREGKGARLCEGNCKERRKKVERKRTEEKIVEM